jgi:hypothetical protein
MFSLWVVRLYGYLEGKIIRRETIHDLAYFIIISIANNGSLLQ